MITKFKGGEVILEGDAIDLKIDSKRWVYIKKKKDGIFHKSPVQISQGLTKFEKEKLLVEYYSLISESMEDSDEKSDSEETEEEKGDENKDEN